MSSELAAGDGAKIGAGAELAPNLLAPNLAISVQGIGKRYEVFASAGARLKKAVARAMGRSEAAARCSREFWALRDVSFDVAKGEAVGIIGRNGSGKSTLMQIVAGTLAPTTGRVLVRGRVAALLELGSGFNREFTGRENIFLSGSILGIPKSEMEKRFDEIAAFADIGEFLDQPVQVYSSGMHARLAFSVSISVDPDVLILDEILSVGDAAFQQRCIGRLQTLLDKGVTLLFVSHNADAVKSICRTGLFLHHGRAICIGPAERAVDEYLSHVRGSTTKSARKRNAALDKPVAFEKRVESSLRYGLGHAQVESVRLMDVEGRTSDAFKLGEMVVLEVVVRAQLELQKLDLSFEVRDRAGVDLFGASVKSEGRKLPRLKKGDRVKARFMFKNVLRPGPHGVCVTLKKRPDRRGEGLITLDHLDACAAFTSLKLPGKKVRGKVRLPVKAEWVLVSEEEGTVVVVEGGKVAG